MTLRSAARPQRALARHSAGTCISPGTFQSHLCFTPITLVIHLFLSRSHFFHLWVTWSAKCPVNASLLTCQGLEASFYKAFNNLLVFSAKAFPISVPLISFQCLSFPSVVSSQPFPGHFPCSKPTVWPMTEPRRPTLMPLSVILLPICMSGKQLATFYEVALFNTRFKFHIFHCCIYLITHYVITKLSCSGRINISIIKISHKIFNKAFWSLLCKGDIWAVDRAGTFDSEIDTVKEWMVWLGTDTLKMVCADTKNKIIQQW